MHKAAVGAHKLENGGEEGTEGRGRIGWKTSPRCTCPSNTPPVCNTNNTMPKPHKPILSVYGTGSVANSAAAVYAHKGARPHPKACCGYRGPRGDVEARDAHLLWLLSTQLRHGGAKLARQLSARNKSAAYVRGGGVFI